MDRDNIKLVNVDMKNFDDLIGLEVNEDQKNYVADNCYSLAEAYATNAEGKGAANLVDPYACKKIIEELPEVMDRYKFRR